MDWHARSVDAVLEELDADADGLTSADAAARLETYGPNELPSEDGVSPLELFVSQFQNVLVYLLVLAALLSLAVGFLPGQDPHYTDAVLITLILLANGVFGFVQDYRAERSIEALRELAAPQTTVLRDGKRRTVEATQVVPGDVVVLEQGDAIPADARLVEGHSLETDESALTGESTTVAKTTGALEADAPLAERTNMVYMGTTVVRGRGRAVVVETGEATEVGAIATGITEAVERETPFQREVGVLARRIGIGIVGLIVFIAAVQALATTTDPLLIALVAITLAVAAVPEGLPAVVTLTLALGSRAMLRRNALVRKLPVVESLGSVDVVVTDKTGTLTENSMTVTRVLAGDAVYEVTGTGTSTDGRFERDGDPVDAPELEPLLRCGRLCNNAEPAPPEEDETDYYGDPTEIAVLVAAAKGGVDPDGERLREVPFSSERKRMTVVVDGDAPTAYVKGAPEVVLERCTHVLADGESVPLDDARREELLAAVQSFTGRALRVLGFAQKTGVDPEADPDDLESDLVFLGLQGMIDPPRSEVRRAVADCRDAGIRVVMATGDNLGTAKAIGEQIGFDPEGALTGPEVDDYDDEAFGRVVEDVEVFARVSPAHKVRLLTALQGNDHNVAMTGDGVNDAPALRNADVGISMGERGTQVAQQASDMILLDDNFVTIRDAVAEGRGIFDNIRKFVNYLLSANAGEVLVVFLGVLLGGVLFPQLFAGEATALVLTPVMLLWINLVTDGLPALALGADPKAETVMSRPPRGDDEPIIDREIAVSILGIGVGMTVIGLVLFFAELGRGASLARAQTLLFTFLVTVELIRIQTIRRRYEMSPLSNRWLVVAVASSFLLQLAVVYTPVNRYFSVVPLSLGNWGLIAAGWVAFLAYALAVEWVLRRSLGGETGEVDAEPVGGD